MHVKKRLSTLGMGAALAAALTLAGGTAVAGQTGTDGQAAPPAPPATTEIRNAAAPGVIPGSYIVALKGAPSVHKGGAAAVRAEAQGLVAAHGGKVAEVYSTVFRGFAVKATKAQARKLAAAPEVRYVEADVLAHAAGEQQNPPSWGLDRIDGSMNRVYAYPNEGSGTTVYVADTGIDVSHTNFEGRAKSGYDFIDDDNDADDCQGHGTHVAGTVGSKDYGVAKKATLVAVRVLDCQGSGPYSGVISGIEWAAQNASGPAVGNMSLSGPASASVDEAVRGAAQDGVVFAVAAGNASTDACGSSPARAASAITVGSTAQGDARSSFSNYGRCLDLFAPGSSIVSTRMGGGTATMNGTSMASPHAAGAAALYLSAHPGATAQQIHDALASAAESGKVGNPGSGSPNRLLNVTGLG
ncbi:S8 family peptidase [Actinomadura sp. KC06]|uniref:S8 family peptidase n=1 Tax=Actinomadura sp. KC06 TaxID=2530369 RepID=UPI00104C863B|nr:S8 family peptidase [Actinomadura sp. KC06]TDD29276.1 S8 family peptidase [Actinomadura sp. KC06]